MDLDATLKAHGNRLGEIESFVEHVKGLMNGADEHVSKATDTLDELVAFKSAFEAALPDLRKAIADVAAVVDDMGKIKADLAPVLEWVAEQQKAAEEAKAKNEAEEKLKAEAAAKAQAEHGERAAAEHPHAPPPTA